MNKLFFLIPLLSVAFIPLAIAQQAPSQPVLTIGQNYDLLEDYQLGVATWQSHTERIFDGTDWKDFIVYDRSDIIQVESNSIGSLVYSKNNCSYSIYENGYVSSDKRIIPSVSWMPRIAEVGTDNYSEMTDLYNQQCTVNIQQGEDWVKITSVKIQTEDLPPLVVQHLNGTSSTYSQGITQVATTTQTLDIRTDNGIKETVSVFNGNPEWSNHKFALTQTVHTGDTITLADQTYDVAAASGTVLDRQWIENNEAEIFEIADSLSYDFDVGFEQFNALQVIDDGGVYKVALDYSVNVVTPYLSSYTVDPTFGYVTASSQGRVGTQASNDSNICSLTVNTFTNQFVGYQPVTGTNDECQFGFAAFDVTTLTGTTVTSGNFKFDVDVQDNSKTCDLNLWTTDTSTKDQTDLDDTFSTNRIIADDSSACQSTGNDKVIALSNLSLINTELVNETEIVIAISHDQSLRPSSSRANWEFSDPRLEITYFIPTQPSAPANLSAVSGIPIALDWDASTDLGGAATGDMTYKVERSDYEFAESPLPINAGSDSAVNMSTNVLLYHLDEVGDGTSYSTTGSPTISSLDGKTLLTYTGSGTLVLPSAVTADVLLVGAGGGGGCDNNGARGAGGGGAGAYIPLDSHSLSAGTYSVTVGSGGSSCTGSSSTIGGDGGDTTFDSTTASGGGYGGGHNTLGNTNGNASGGGSGNETIPQRSTDNNGTYGYGGGSGTTSPSGPYGAGGGGGAGGLGGDWTSSSTGGIGGAGVTWTDGNTYSMGGAGSGQGGNGASGTPVGTNGVNYGDGGGGGATTTPSNSISGEGADGVVQVLLNPSYQIEDTSGANNDSENPQVTGMVSSDAQWDNLGTSMSDSGSGTVTKSGSDSWSSVADTTQTFTVGSPFSVETSATSTHWVFGIMRENDHTAFGSNNGGQFQIHPTWSNTFDVYDYSGSSSQTWSFSGWSSSDVFKIEVDASGNPTFYQNGNQLATSGIGQATGTYVGGVGLYTSGVATMDVASEIMVNPTFSTGNIQNQIDDPLLTVKSTSLYDGTDSHTVGGWTSAIGDTTTTHMDTLSETISSDQWMNSNTGGATNMRGEKVETTSSALYDIIPNKVTMKLKKQGSPTGDISVLIVDSGGSTLHTIGTIDSSTLTTTYTDYTVTNNALTYKLAEDDRIVAYFPFGDNSNSVSLGNSGSDVFDGTDSVKTFRDTVSGNVWMETSGTDSIMKVETFSAGGTGTMLSFENTAGETISYEIESDKLRVAKTGSSGTISENFTPQLTWTNTGGTNDVRIANGVLDFNNVANGSDKRQTTDLGVVLPDDWTLKMKYKYYSSNAPAHYIGVIKSCSGAVNGCSGDALGIGHYSDVNTADITIQYGNDQAGVNPIGSPYSPAYGISTNTDYYLTLEKTGDSATLTVRSGSHTGTVLGTQTETVTGLTGLQYLSFSTIHDGNSGSSLDSTVDDVEVSYSGTKTNIIEATGQTISTSTPSHIQFNRGTVNDWSIYLDGASVATATDSTSLGTASGFSGTKDPTYDGTSQGSITTGVTGKIGNAWTFDGSNDKVDLPPMTLGTEWTFSAWMKNPSVQANEQFLKINAGSGVWCYLPANEKAKCEGATGILTTPDNSFTISNYHLFTVTTDGSTTKIYIDGVQEATTSTSGAVGTITTINLGADNTSNWYSGDMDQVLFYDTALSQSDVTALYNSGSGASPSTTNLIAHYDFEQASTTLENQGNYVAGDPSYYIGQSPTGTNALPSLDEFYIFTSDKSSEASDIYDRGSNVFAQVGSTTGSDTDHDDNSSLVAGTDYYHRIIANNGAFDSVPSAVVQSTAGLPPDAPTSLTAAINNPNTAPLDITLNWNAGASGGTGTFQNYIVIRSPDSTFTSVSTVGTPTGTTYTDTVPSGGGTFYYKVSSQSTHGGSANSSPVNITTPSVPDAPTISLAINNPNPSPLVITTTFNPPGNVGGSAITGYHLFHSGDDVTYTQVATGVAGPYDYTVSTSGTHYFKAQAVNLIGASVDSAAQSIATPTIPGVPQSLTVTIPDADASPYNVQLDWTAPASDGGSAVTGYKLYRDGVLVSTLGVVLTGTDTATSTPSTNFVYTVKALNNIGESATAASYTWTSLAVPPAPASLTVTIPDVDTAPFTVTLDWATPATSDSAVTGYLVHRDSVLIATLGNVLTVQDTTPSNASTNFVYDVYAISNVGTGTASVQQTWTSPAVPSQVQGLSGSMVNSNVALTWSMPASDSAITDFQVIKGGSPLALVGSNSTAYTDSNNIIPDQSLTYSVQGISLVGTGSASSNTVVSTGSAAVLDLSATNVIGNSLVLTWTEPIYSAGTVQGYMVNYTTPGGDPNIILVANTGTPTTVLPLSSLNYNANYTWSVGVITPSGTNADGNWYNVTMGEDSSITSYNVTSGFDLDATNTMELEQIKFDRIDNADGTTTLEVTHPVQYNLNCNLASKFAMTNANYTNLPTTIIDGNDKKASFIFTGLENEIITVKCTDTVYSPYDSADYILTQNEFPLLQQIQNFSNGTYGTSGMFGVIDLISLGAILITMIGFNRVNHVVGGVFAVIMFGVLGWFEIVQWTTVFTGLLATSLMLFIVTQRKK